MDKIFLNEIAWQNTFPQCVMPLPDEWLPGLLLRCDEVNHWESKTTLSYLFRTTGRTSSSKSSSMITVSSLILDCLAQVLAVSRDLLLATTYQAELARLSGTATPHARQLSMRFSFHVCPVCLREVRLLRRVLVLPHITLCPLHHVTLANACQCGSLLHLFSPQTRPFTCPTCSLDWAALPHKLASPERIALEQKILSWYAFFLAEGTPLLLSQSLQRIRLHLKGGKVSRLKCLDGRVKAVEHYELTKASLGYLVDLLVSLDLVPWAAQ